VISIKIDANVLAKKEGVVEETAEEAKEEPKADKTEESKEQPEKNKAKEEKTGGRDEL